MTEQVNILGISGSLRRASFNRGLLHAAQDVAPDGVDIELFDLRELPFYDGDAEAAGDPPAVVELKQAIREADALLIATPEYNRGVPGLLKNAIDWASRPPFASPLTGKPVAIMGSSSGMGGTRRAQQQLRDALSFSRTQTLAEPEVVVPNAYEKFDIDGNLTDDATRAEVAELLDALVAAALRAGSPRRAVAA